VFVDVIVLYSSDLQQGSKLSGVVGWMLYCICMFLEHIYRMYVFVVHVEYSPVEMFSILFVDTDNLL
jgi:hypothetical protein